MAAYGYIRKSRVHDPARTISPEAQERAIRELAAKHGDEDVTILSDLDISGKKRREKRPGWDALLTAVESGEATAVYAYSLSRFARSVPQLAEFAELCERKRIRFYVEVDSIDTSTASGKLVFHVIAALAQFESDVASERVKDAFAAKDGNLDWHGPGAVPYGDLSGEDASVVVGAFREAGSFDGAARLLNERGVPARKRSFHERDSSIGKADAVWHGSTVAGIVRRADPDLAPRQRTTRGAPAGPRPQRLARLLVCGQCGSTMTPSADSRTGKVRYYCLRAKTTPHGRGWVSENVVIAQVRAEAQRQAALFEKRVSRGSTDDSAKMAELEAKRARILDMAADGMIEKADAQRRISEVEEQASRLSTQRWLRQITRFPLIHDVVDPADGEVVTADPPEVVNAYLRRLFDRIVVESMRDPARRGPSRIPVALRFVWRDESLRSTDEDLATDA